MPDSPQQVLKNLLANMQQLGASDVHLKAGYAPYFRVKRVLRAAKTPPVPNSAYILAMLQEWIPVSHQDHFNATGAVDFAAHDDAGTRYRINMFRSMGETHASIRRIQVEIPSFEALGLPPVYRGIVDKAHEGLILVSGVTGTGKSTTLAAMVDQINRTRRIHIVTIEDPIEYVFEPKKAIVSQREIGTDVPDHRAALRSVVRQDPDCILIGELRDRETMLAAFQAAETGHLVLGSVHVAEVQQTFKRLLEYFPSTDHRFIRSTLAGSLVAILCQRLLPGIDAGTYFPAAEILLNTPAVRDKILQERDNELLDLIDRSQDEGMRSFTTSLRELVETGKVHFDTAIDYAPNRDALKSAIRGIKGR